MLESSPPVYPHPPLRHDYTDPGPGAAAGGTILDSGQAPSPHAQGSNKPQGETPRSDLMTPARDPNQ